MERVVRKVPRLVPSTTVYDEVERFVAKDGKEFYRQQDAQDHELHLDEIESFNEKFNRRTVNIDGNVYDVISVHVVNKVTRGAICKMYRWVPESHIDKPGIYLISTDDSGDHVYQYAEYLDEMISETENKLQQLEDLKNDSRN